MPAVINFVESRTQIDSSPPHKPTSYKFHAAQQTTGVFHLISV